MQSKRLLISLFISILALQAFARIGIKAGVNMANEIRSFRQEDLISDFQSENITGFQIGLVFQHTYKDSGFSSEIGALFSQKGSTFKFTNNITESLIEGYNELNYIEIPLNIRYTLSMGTLGIYGFGGMYAGYMLTGKMHDESENEIFSMKFSTFADQLDFGYNFGVGIELLEKIQLGVTWSRGLKTNSKFEFDKAQEPKLPYSKNSLYSVNLVYMF